MSAHGAAAFLGGGINDGQEDESKHTHDHVDERELVNGNEKASALQVSGKRNLRNRRGRESSTRKNPHLRSWYGAASWLVLDAPPLARQGEKDVLD